MKTVFVCMDRNNVVVSVAEVEAMNETSEGAWSAYKSMECYSKFLDDEYTHAITACSSADEAWRIFG